MEWEQREVELERIIANMERTQAEIAGAASQVTFYSLFIESLDLVISSFVNDHLQFSTRRICWNLISILQIV